MELLLCILIGYGLGCINPAWLLSKIKHIDLQKSGTGNLGTTNTFINFGKGWGCVVLAVDMAKAVLAVKLCQWLFPSLALAGVAAGCMVVMGHIFPFLYAAELGSVAAFLILAVCSCVIIYKHFGNIKNIRAGKEMQIRTFLKTHIFGEDLSHAG